VRWADGSSPEVPLLGILGAVKVEMIASSSSIRIRRSRSRRAVASLDRLKLKAES
jgi:hypothetical protein